MTFALTPSQTALLRRIGDGTGLPAYLLRPRSCAPDIELLCGDGLLDAHAGELSITAAGVTHLDHLDAVRISHGRDSSITMEYRPGTARS